MLRKLTRVQMLKEQAFYSLERFLHIEAMSGVALLCAAALALIWANSPAYESYDALLAMPLGISLGGLSLSWDVHFWINDILMAVFFLVVGMEIRREMHQGVLSNWRQAALPMVAAMGGVCLPAAIYIALNGEGVRFQGWAVPTATDIAFAVGVLALLGRVIPANLRIILLSLAIIDDVIAVVIIALFYSDGLNWQGMGITVLGLSLVFFFQWLGCARPQTYLLPAMILWWGLWQAGVHPSLAGVILGLVTPVLPPRSDLAPLTRLSQALHILRGETPEQFPKNVKCFSDKNCDENKGSERLILPGEVKTALEDDQVKIFATLRDISRAQRDLMAPVTRVEQTLHPWVAFGIMPLFAFANAGVRLQDVDLTHANAHMVLFGVCFGLLLGKPIGVLLASFMAVKLKLCHLPPQVDWVGMMLVGFLAGIGFTMAIFVAMLAFDHGSHLVAAKIGVLSGSGLSALLGLGFGLIYRAKKRGCR